MLPDNFVCKAVFAAAQALEIAWDWSDLRHQREETVRAQVGRVGQRREPCLCRGAGPKAFGPLPRLRPMTGFEGNEDLLVPFPLCYFAWRVRDCVMPGIEIVELPWPLGLAEGAEPQRDFRRRLGGAFHLVRLMHDLPGDGTDPVSWTDVLTPQRLWEVRKTVALECFDRNEKFGHVYFSCLDLHPETSQTSPSRHEPVWVEPGAQHLLFAYAAALHESLKMAPWELHQRRVLCAFQGGEFVPVHARTFVVLRSDKTLRAL